MAVPVPIRADGAEIAFQVEGGLVDLVGVLNLIGADIDFRPRDVEGGDLVGDHQRLDRGGQVGVRRGDGQLRGRDQGGVARFDRQVVGVLQLDVHLDRGLDVVGQVPIIAAEKVEALIGVDVRRRVLGADELVAAAGHVAGTGRGRGGRIAELVAIDKGVGRAIGREGGASQDAVGVGGRADLATGDEAAIVGVG